MICVGKRRHNRQGVNGMLPYALFLAAQTFLACATWGADVAWEGKGKFRVLVTVNPVEIGERASDELVASYDLDLDAIPGVPTGCSLDLDSVQIIRYDPKSGAAEEYDNYVYATSRFDRPFQFYDAAYPESFPNYVGYITSDVPSGKSPKQYRMTYDKFGARYYNAVAGARKGKIVWPHTQIGHEPSRYAIYFDVLPLGKPPLSPPAGWVGDGSGRFIRETENVGPPGNVKGTVLDWNGDGLLDVLFGCTHGYVLLYLNTGTVEEPEYRSKQFLMDDQGLPIDVGYDSCPIVVDWNRDGKRDLLIGAGKGGVVYYENVGTDAEPVFRFSGLLKDSNGQPIKVPARPIGEKVVENAFREDYYPVPWVVDWNSDGEPDLMLGGYVTGYIFYYECAGRDAEGLPILEYRGPLEADGKPVDTIWVASPTTGDLTGDGLPDLVSGGFPMGPTLGGGSDPLRSLYYYENVGTAASPKLAQRQFPWNRPPPFGGFVFPTLVDWNHDGLLDLVIIDGRGPLYFVRNIGTREKPLFDMNLKPVRGWWGLDAIWAERFEDVNHDGFPDALMGFNIEINAGKPIPCFFGQRVNFNADGRVRHPHAFGDENAHHILYDFDGNGILDALYGTHSGHVWLHRNRGDNLKPDLDATGEQLRLASGSFIKVGLPEGYQPEAMDFAVLQGARPRIAPADFDRNGTTDLVIGDTYGKVRYFANIGTNEQPVFADPVLLHEWKNRLYVTALDWNEDGFPDLAILTSGIQIMLNKAVPSRAEFDAPFPLPDAPLNVVTAAMTDLNRDGDMDLVFTTGYSVTHFIERSFLAHGYCNARVISVEARDDR